MPPFADRFSPLFLQGARALQALGQAADRLRRIEGWRRYIVAFGLGALTATALAPYYVLPALIVGLSGLVLLLDSTAKARNPRWAAFATGWTFGFGYFLFGMYWLAFAFLVQADEFAWMIPIAVPGFTGFLGLFIGGAALLCTAVWKRFGLDGPTRVFIFAAAWGVFEFLRGTILTGLPWNLVGQAFAGTALLAQTAAWIGPYGLSLVVTLLAVLPAGALLAHGKWRPAPLWGLVGGIGILLLIGAVRLSGPTALTDDRYVVIAQPNISQRDKFDTEKLIPNFERLVKITRDAIPPGAETYAVWPENAYPFLAQDPGAPRFFGQALPPNAHLLSGTYRSYDQGEMTLVANSAALFGATDKAGEKPLTGIYDKHHLVPFGEYLPFKGLLKYLGLSQLAPVEDGFTPGPGPRTFMMGQTRIAPAICYEDVFPRALYPQDERPDLLVVVTNDAWFGDGAGPQQHLDISRLRAIESGLPMARSANTGISALIGPRGEMLDHLPLYTEGVIQSPLPEGRAQPLYDRLGNGIFALLLLLVASMPRIAPLARWG